MQRKNIQYSVSAWASGGKKTVEVGQAAGSQMKSEGDWEQGSGGAGSIWMVDVLSQVRADSQVLA